MDKMSEYIDVVLEPWQIAQRAESVAQALSLIEQKFGIVFIQVDFEVIENNETPTDPSEDEEG
jgi:hypothetical protein